VPTICTLGWALPQRDGGALRNAGRTPEEKEPQIAVAGRTFRQGFDQIDAGLRVRATARGVARDASNNPIVSHSESAHPFTSRRKRASRCAYIVISTPSVTTSAGVVPCASSADAANGFVATHRIDAAT